MNTLYDDFSADYDRFVDWSGRLAAEMPFLERTLHEAGARRVLDAACGTGMHALALAERGFEVGGADFSPGMIAKAKENAAAAGAEVRFETAGFGALAGAFGVRDGSAPAFDALLCLGNSLPHALTRPDLDAALADFAACLRPGGLLVVQNRNFDAVLRAQQRWMEPQSAREGSKEWLFVRFYDFDPDGLITFHLLTLRREGAGAWRQAQRSARLRPLLRDELEAALAGSGFTDVRAFGDLAGSPFDAGASGNLVLTARR